MYAKIKSQPTALQKYTKRLTEDGLLPEGEIDQIKTKFQSFLSQEFEASKSYKPNKADWADGTVRCKVENNCTREARRLLVKNNIMK